jgi:hypothetical protein
MLIFLSGLQSISPSIYESCQVEGATAWETFWKITLPMISPMILVNAIYTVVDLFTAADNRVDTRVMFSAGLAAQRLNWLEGCCQVFAIPVSASSKNPFFDRKPKEQPKS